MELVTDFENLTMKILDKYKEKEIPITVGVLIADYRQDMARQYILNYLNRFDEKSGKYIDFYLPGYYLYCGDTKDDWKERNQYYVCTSRHKTAEPFYFNRTGKKYYFDDWLFEEFLRDMESKIHVDYTYNPMLLLVEVNNNIGRGRLEFQRKMVIELDNTKQGINRSGCLFDEIFKIAKREVNLDRFGKEIKIRYIKGCAIASIAKALDGNYLEVIQENAEQVLRYRIK